MKNKLLISISLLAIFSVLLMPAISQDPQYHNFADQTKWFGIPNFLNVMSNIPYLIAGFTGFRFVSGNQQLVQMNNTRVIYLLFFISVFLVGMGSAYYHLSPDNSTLIWDRLPMSMAFMSFFIIILAEYIDARQALRLAAPLLLLAVISVVYWYWSELAGQGDLRMYALIQFLPMILIPLILMLYSSRFNKAWLLWVLLGCYLLAKVFELMDVPVYQFTSFISGHTLKHIVSAAGPYMLYLVLKDLKTDK